MKSLPLKYQEILIELKEKIRDARTKAVYSVNVQLLSIYWEIGHTIIKQQDVEGWGTKVIDRLSADLKSEFPDMKGLSVRNIKYMRAFAEAYPEFIESSEKTENPAEINTSTIVQVPLAQITQSNSNQFMQVNLAQISWYHHITLLDKIKDTEIRFFYIQKTIENGWSRDVMVHQIESGLYNRVGKISSNFQQVIAPPNSELVQQVFKDPYKFDFIYLGAEAKERDLEDALTKQMTKFLLELGQWFAFVGRQYKINLGDKEYFFDLLFYHTRLKRYIIIDLKIDEFKPEYKGKMDFYLTLADDQLKDKNDDPSIGIILCKTKDGLVAKYALRDSTKPIGVAEYQINNILPQNIQGELPTIEELETELEKEFKEFEKPLDKKINRLKELLNNFKQEEVKLKRNPESTAQLFNDFILPLKRSIVESLKTEIIPLFQSFDCMIYTAGQGHNSDEKALGHLANSLNNNCDAFRIEFRFLGLKRAGEKAFDIWKDIRIQLNNYTYLCEIGGVAGVLLEKLYHQIADDTEIKKLAEVFSEWIVEDINQRIEQINKN